MADEIGIFEQLVEAFNERNWEVYGEYLAEDLIVHSGETTHRGLDSFQELTSQLLSTYPDVRMSVLEVMVSDNHLAARIEVEGMPDDGSIDVLDLSGIVHGHYKDEEFTEIWTMAV